MLPDSYHIASNETKLGVQLLMAHTRGHLQSSGRSLEVAHQMYYEIEKGAVAASATKAVKAWEESRTPCSAEQFVQWFAASVWSELTGHDGRPFNYVFPAPVVGTPLSTEFLQAVGITEKEALTRPTSLETRFAPTTPTIPPAQRVSTEPQFLGNVPTLGKRKNDAPDATTHKYRRGDDGHRVLPGLSGKNSTGTDVQWSGVPLTPQDGLSMDYNLMYEIWSSSWLLLKPWEPYYQHMTRHAIWSLEVKIPREKAWELLGKDIMDVFALMERKRHPFRLHVQVWDTSLCVGLWVNKSHTQTTDVVRDRLPEMFRLLRRWSFQVGGYGGRAESLRDFIAGYSA